MKPKLPELWYVKFNECLVFSGTKHENRVLIIFDFVFFFTIFLPQGKISNLTNENFEGTSSISVFEKILGLVYFSGVAHEELFVNFFYENI